jgi:DnaA family protein
MPTQLTLEVLNRDIYDLDLFFAGPNAEALAAVRRAVAGEPPQRLLLHGPAGSGRSHLLLGAVRAAGASGRRAAYLSLDAADSPQVLDGFDRLALVCVDDLDARIRERDWALGLLRLLDAIRAHGGAIVLAASQPPERIEGLLPDLKTRLAASAVYGLKSLDDTERRQLLQRRAEVRGLDLPSDVADYLVRRLPRDGASLLRALDMLDRASLSAQRRRLTLPFVQAQLALPAPTSAQKAAD